MLSLSPPLVAVIKVYSSGIVSLELNSLTLCLMLDLDTFLPSPTPYKGVPPASWLTPLWLCHGLSFLLAAGPTALMNWAFYSNSVRYGPPSTSSERIKPSPSLVIRPKRLLSPDCSMLGTNPKYAATWSARLNREGSSTVAIKVIAVRTPTPGMLIKRRHSASVRACRFIC